MANTEVKAKQIKDEDITVLDIANGAVTLAKMANVATGTVFYRKTAGDGAPEVQALATLKTDLNLVPSDDTTTDEVVYPVWSMSLTGSQVFRFSTTKLTFNPSTGLLTITGSIDVGVQLLGNSADTPGTPTFSWAGDPDTGMYSPGANLLAFSVAGTQAIRISSTGRVGCGPAAATDRFEVSFDGAAGVVLRRTTDAITSAGLNIGKIDWYSDDSTLTNGNTVARLLVQSASVFTTDPAGRMIFYVAGSVATTGLVECMRMEATSVPKLGFFGVTAVVKPTALTGKYGAGTTVTCTAPATADFAVAGGTSGGFGYSSADEFRTVNKVIGNLQTRVGELETKLQGLGLLT